MKDLSKSAVCGSQLSLFLSLSVLDCPFTSLSFHLCQWIVTMGENGIKAESSIYNHEQQPG